MAKMRIHFGSSPRSSSSASQQPAAGSITRRANQGQGRTATALFFLIFALVGGLITYFMLVRPLLGIMSARNWVTTPCTVLASEVKSHSDSDGTTYSVAIRYRYEVAGQRYESDRYDFMSGSSSGYDGKARIVGQYPVGSSQICFVNPHNPSQAVLNRSFTPTMWFGLIPLVFVAVGVIGLLAQLRPRSSSLQGTALTGSGAGLQAKLQEHFGRKVAAYDWLPAMKFDTPAVLEAKASTAIGGAVVILIFALVWNGVVFGALVRNVVKSWARGDPDICQTLFSIPFVAGGVFMIGLSAYFFLKTFNPRPRLTLSSALLPLGGSFDLSWELIGNTTRLANLKLTLLAREEATYRRGTSTYTDRHTFLELPIAELEAGRDPQFSGKARVDLPADAMHSFESTNNKIVWQIQVKGEIPRWPNVDETFPITVVPADLVERLQREAVA